MTPESFRSVLFRLVLVPVAVLAAAVAVLLLQINSLRNSAVWVDHTDVVISQTGVLLNLFVEQENSFRGFLLTGDPLMFEPYTRASREVPVAMDRLQALTADNTQQQQTISAIRQEYAEWSQKAEQRVQAGNPHENIVPDTLAGKQQMDRIRASVRQMINREEQLRSERVANSLYLLRYTFLVLGAVGLLAALLIAWSALRQISDLTAAYDRRLADVQRQSEWLNTTLRSIGDGVIACDAKGRLVFMNGVAEELTGWTAAEAHGKPVAEVFQIINEHTRAVVENPIEIVHRTGAVAGLANPTKLIRRDGTEIPVADSAAPIRGTDDELTGTVLVFRNVTEQKNAAEALRRAEKVSVAARLASSIAHEINNPLEALTNLLYLAASSKTIEETREFVEVGQEQLQRASAIVAQTLEFHRGSPDPTECSIPDILDSVLSIWQRRFASRHIAIDRDYAGSPPIRAYDSELRQMMTNLVANAFESMNSHGRMIVRARVVGAGQRLRITFADAGCGIDPAVQRRIFEPFFTTKSTGTGLGLWVTAEIARKHQGTVKIRSRRANPSGTVISVSLPLRPATPSAFQVTLEHVAQQ